MLVAAGAVALLGLVDDVWRLRRRVLVAGTAVPAACVVPYGETGVGAGLPAVAWVVAVVFGLRGLDHADGPAGAAGVVAAFGVAARAAVEVMDGIAGLLSVLAAAPTGFLLHNWHPARVALGACGSMSAGFVIAVGAVYARAGSGVGESAGVLFALTAVAAADAVLVLGGRDGRPAGRCSAAGPIISRTGCGGSGRPRRGRFCCWGPGRCRRCSSGYSRMPAESGPAPCGGWWEGGSSWCSPRACPCVRTSTQCIHAGQSAIACKERIRVEPARLSSVDRSGAVVHT